MTRSIFLVLVLQFSGCCWASWLFGAEETEAAEAKTMDQLMADRKAVAEAAAGLKKSWEGNEAEFRKTKPFMEHDAKQRQIQQTFIDVDKRLKDLDSQIVERMAKEYKAKEAKK